MSLQEEIDQRRREIHTDAYPMSIGELINLYRDEEIDLHPEFQRFYRWKYPQKSKLIESLMLGIPVPSIFVAQRQDGVWDVVDGLQRLATIFEFVGVLKDEDGKTLPPSTLTATTYLPSLQGKVWQGDTEDAPNAFDSAQRMLLKRTKLAINIVKRESPEETKLELFHRLNSMGTLLSDQENRDCLLIMANRELHLWGQELRKLEAFQRAISLSDRLMEQKFDTELVWRFVLMRRSTVDQFKRISDMADYVTEGVLELASDEQFDAEAEAKIFKQTFELLDRTLGDDAFRKYDPTKDGHVRSFLISGFEPIAVGLSKSLDGYQGADAAERVRQVVQQIWTHQTFDEYTGSGVTPARRMSHTISLGVELFESGKAEDA